VAPELQAVDIALELVLTPIPEVDLLEYPGHPKGERPEIQQSDFFSLRIGHNALSQGRQR